VPVGATGFLELERKVWFAKQAYCRADE